MELVIILIIVGLLIYWRSSTLPTDAFSKNEPCKLHTWKYFEDSGKMVCEVCKQVAGLVETDKGNY